MYPLGFHGHVAPHQRPGTRSAGTDALAAGTLSQPAALSHGRVCINSFSNRIVRLCRAAWKMKRSICVCVRVRACQVSFFNTCCNRTEAGNIHAHIHKFGCTQILPSLHMPFVTRIC